MFFLPGKKSEILRIQNRDFKEIKLVETQKFDNVFNVKMIKEKASKNEYLEIEVSPEVGEGKGTYQSNITLTIARDDDKKTKLTIPIKIVRY